MGPLPEVTAALKVGIAMLTVVKVCILVGMANAKLAVVLGSPFVMVGTPSDDWPALLGVVVRNGNDGNMTDELLSCWLELAIEDVSGIWVGKVVEGTVEN